VPVVVCSTGGEAGPLELPRSVLVDTEIRGGVRTLHELAVAVAATSRDVELRGRVSEPELAQLVDGTGAAPRVDLPPRPPGPQDVVIVPEGYRDPVPYALISDSPAVGVIMLLGPPGLAGWPFVPDWPGKPDPLTVPVEDLARPEHFRAMASAGFHLWTHIPGLARAAIDAGVACTDVGVGTPVPFPTPVDRPFDVVWVQANRWAPLARQVVERLDVRQLAIPEVPHARILRLLASARVLVWPSRVEGQARIQAEARAVGTVPVALDSNPFAPGMAEEDGVVPVGSVDQMPAAITGLLSDRARLEELSRRARRWARTRFDWSAYVARVDRPSAPWPIRHRTRACGPREETGWLNVPAGRASSGDTVGRK
jgi:hypothetical protein